MDFLKQYAQYSFGLVVKRLAAFLLLPLYTRFLTPADYGVLDIVTTFGTLIQPVCMLGLDSAIQILYFSVDNEQERDEIIATGLAVIFVVTILAGLGIMALATPISQLLFRNTTQALPLQLMGAFICAASLGQIMHNTLRLRRQPLLFSFVAIGQLVVTVGVNIVLIVYGGMGATGYIISLVIAEIVTALFLAVVVMRTHWRWPARKHLWPLFRLGVPLIPVMLAYWMLNLSDRFFLARLATTTEIGLYGVAVRLAAAVGIFTTAVQLGWRPFALGMQKDPQARAFYAAMPLFYFAVTGVIGLALGVAAPLILAVMTTSAYAPALVLLCPLILAQIMYGAYYVFSTGLEIAQRTYHLSWVIALAAACNFASNIVLIPYWGAFGASIATGFAYSVATIVVAVVAQRIYPLPYARWRLPLMIGAIIGAYMAITIFYWAPAWAWVSLSVGVVSVLLLMVSVWPEVSQAWPAIKRWQQARLKNVAL